MNADRFATGLFLLCIGVALILRKFIPIPIFELAGACLIIYIGIRQICNSFNPKSFRNRWCKRCRIEIYQDIPEDELEPEIHMNDQHKYQ